MKTKTLLIFLFVAFFIGTSYGQEMKDQADEKTVTGTIVQRKGLNKAGNELPGPGDYYLEFKGESYFVKLSESNITADELSVFVGKKLSYKIQILDGLWDTDNPEVQSRIGEYVRILAVLE